MSRENAKKFVETVETDNALQERVKNLSIDEVLTIAKELGYEFTIEELEHIGDQELTSDELESVAGGRGIKRIIKTGKPGKHCNDDPSQPLHTFVCTGNHREIPFLLLWTEGQDEYVCTNCGYKTWSHVAP